MLPFNITLKQAYVLRQLSRAEYIHPSDLAEMLFCDRPTAAVVIRNMEKQKWVERETDPEDRRRFRIRISRQGRAKLKSLEGAKGPGFNPLGCLTKAEAQQLDDLLGRVLAHMREKIAKKKRV